MSPSTPAQSPLYWREQLDSGLSRLGLALDRAQQEGLLGYLGLLLKWNRVYNLSAVRDPREMVGRQLLDSLAVAPYLHGDRVLDLGTGAGLPGIPLAIAEPRRRFTLIDSNGKKTRFVQQSVIELGLGNVEVVRARVEAFRPDLGFDTVTARAFASLPELLGAEPAALSGRRAPARHEGRPARAGARRAGGAEPDHPVDGAGAGRRALSDRGAEPVAAACVWSLLGHCLVQKLNPVPDRPLGPGRQM